MVTIERYLLFQLSCHASMLFCHKKWNHPEPMPLIVKNFCAHSSTDWWMLSKLASDLFIISLATSTSLIRYLEPHNEPALEYWHAQFGGWVPFVWKTFPESAPDLPVTIQNKLNGNNPLTILAINFDALYRQTFMSFDISVIAYALILIASNPCTSIILRPGNIKKYFLIYVEGLIFVQLVDFWNAVMFL